MSDNRFRSPKRKVLPRIAPVSIGLIASAALAGALVTEATMHFGSSSASGIPTSIQVNYPKLEATAQSYAAAKNPTAAPYKVVSVRPGSAEGTYAVSLMGSNGTSATVEVADSGSGDKARQITLPASSIALASSNSPTSTTSTTTSPTTTSTTVIAPTTVTSAAAATDAVAYLEKTYPSVTDFVVGTVVLDQDSDSYQVVVHSSTLGTFKMVVSAVNGAISEVENTPPSTTTTTVSPASLSAQLVQLIHTYLASNYPSLGQPISVSISGDQNGFGSGDGTRAFSVIVTFPKNVRLHVVISSTGKILSTNFQGDRVSSDGGPATELAPSSAPQGPVFKVGGGQGGDGGNSGGDN